MKTFIEYNEEQELNESAGFLVFAQALLNSGLSPIQATLVYIGATLGPLAIFFGVINKDNIKQSIKRALKDFKAKKKLTPETINDLKNKMKSAEKDLSSGKKSYLKQLSNKLNASKDKNQLLNVKREIENYISRNKNNDE